jgi:hypothetical protein
VTSTFPVAEFARTLSTPAVSARCVSIDSGLSPDQFGR